MSHAETRKVLESYFDSEHSDLSSMAEDVVFTEMATGQEHHGRDGVQQMLHHFYSVAFDATAETRNLVYGDHNAVWEGHFVGTHVGEFAGIPATGKEVRVPLTVVYDIADGKIAAGRIYLMGSVLMQQLGVA